MDKIYVFIAFVVPGFISLKAYELFFPSQNNDPSKRLIDAVSYSCINYAVLMPLILWVEHSKIAEKEYFLYICFYFIVIFIFPILLTFFWKKIRETKWLQKNMPHPTLTTWDFLFAQRKEYWVKIVKNDGSIIGGAFSTKSFASSAPAPEAIYIEETWVINKDTGKFERPVTKSSGLLILSKDISHIELRKYGN